MAMRDTLGRWLFEEDPREDWPGSSPSDAEWDNWVERNQEQWREIADRLLAESPAKSLVEFAQWIVSMDDPDPESQGRRDRSRVTLTKIIERARLALDS